jgi:hypothetical protein
MEMGLSVSSHITICFDFGFKSISRSDARNACLTRLRHMETPFGMDYSNPLDVGTHPITQNQTRFIKAHLTQPHVDSFALLRGD